jgi:hypothetical protein
MAAIDGCCPTAGSTGGCEYDCRCRAELQLLLLCVAAAARRRALQQGGVLCEFHCGQQAVLGYPGLFSGSLGDSTAVLRASYALQDVRVASKCPCWPCLTQMRLLQCMLPADAAAVTRNASNAAAKCDAHLKCAFVNWYLHIFNGCALNPVHFKSTWLVKQHSSLCGCLPPLCAAEPGMCAFC